MSKTITEELKEAGKNRQKEKLRQSTESLRYTVKGLALLLEAAAMAVTSGYTIYSGWNADLPNWGSAVLLVAGSFIAIRAFVEFVKFLNRR